MHEKRNKNNNGNLLIFLLGEVSLSATFHFVCFTTDAVQVAQFSLCSFPRAASIFLFIQLCLFHALFHVCALVWLLWSPVVSASNIGCKFLILMVSLETCPLSWYVLQVVSLFFTFLKQNSVFSCVLEIAKTLFLAVSGA